MGYATFWGKTKLISGMTCKDQTPAESVELEAVPRRYRIQSRGIMILL